MAELFPAVQSFLRGQATLKEVEDVLEEGADPNGWTGPATPVKCAIQAHHKQLLQLLLDKSAAVDDKDSRGVSPLHVAVFEGKSDCIQSLLDAGADANILDQFGQSPLFFAPTRVVCEQLVAGRADVNLHNSKNQSPVHLAAHAGLDDTVSYLAALAGAKAVNGQDQHGHTPLYYAAHSRVKSTIHVLKRMGAERPHRSRLRGAVHRRVEAVAEAAAHAEPAVVATGPVGAEAAAGTESVAPPGDPLTDAGPARAEAAPGREEAEPVGAKESSDSAGEVAQGAPSAEPTSEEEVVVGEAAGREVAARGEVSGAAAGPSDAAPAGAEAASGAALLGQEDAPEASGAASGARAGEAGAADENAAASADGTVEAAALGEEEELADTGNCDPPQVYIAAVTTQAMDLSPSRVSGTPKHSITESGSDYGTLRVVARADTDAGTVLSAAGEEQMPLEGFLPSSGQLGEPLPDLKAGDVIMVVRSLMADNEDALHLERGQRGFVEVIDEEGDALIDFDDHEVPQWVCAAHFGHLSLVGPRPATTSSSQQLDVRVPTPTDTLVAGWSQHDADLFGEACGGVLDLAATQIQKRYRGVRARRQSSALQFQSKMRELFVKAARNGTLGTALAAAKAKVAEQQQNAPAAERPETQPAAQPEAAPETQPEAQPEVQPDAPPAAVEALAQEEERHGESQASGEPKPEVGGGPPLHEAKKDPADAGRDHLLAALEGTWPLLQGEPGSVLVVDAQGGYTLTNRNKESTVGKIEVFEAAELLGQEFWQLRRTDARSGTRVDCFGNVRGTELWLSDAANGWDAAGATPSLHACGKLGTEAAVVERGRFCESMAGNYSGWQGEPDSVLALDSDGNYSVRGGRSHSVGVVEVFGKVERPGGEGAWWQLRLTCSAHWEDGNRNPSEEGRSLYLLGTVKSDDGVLWLGDCSMSKEEGWDPAGTSVQRKTHACKRVPPAAEGAGAGGAKGSHGTEEEAGHDKAGQASVSAAGLAAEEPQAESQPVSTGPVDEPKEAAGSPLGHDGEAEEAPLRVGGPAWIYGFTDPKREQLNGMQCTLQEHLADEDRWILLLADSPKKMKVKPTHLRGSPLPGFPPAASSEGSKAPDQKVAASSESSKALDQKPATSSESSKALDQKQPAAGALDPDRLPESSKAVSSSESPEPPKTVNSSRSHDGGAAQATSVKREEKKNCLYWEVRLEKASPDDKFGFVQANGKLEFETRLASLSPRAGEQKQQASSSPLPGPDCLIVRRIHEGGLMQEWNGQHPDVAVQPQDRILSVNGYRTVEEMQKQIRERSVVMQLVRYPEHFSVYLRKDSGRLGFRFERPVNASVGGAEGLRITEVMLEGAVPEHNLQQVEMANWHNVVLPDMRITGVNDTSGDVLEIAAELKRSDNVTLHLRRAEQDLAVKQQMRARMNMLTGGLGSPKSAKSTSRTPRGD